MTVLFGYAIVYSAFYFCSSSISWVHWCSSPNHPPPQYWIMSSSHHTFHPSLSDGRKPLSKSIFLQSINMVNNPGWIGKCSTNISQQTRQLSTIYFSFQHIVVHPCDIFCPPILFSVSSWSCFFSLVHLLSRFHSHIKATLHTLR